MLALKLISYIATMFYNLKCTVGNVCCRNLEKAGERGRGLPGGGTPRFVGHAQRSRWSPCVGGGTAPRPSVASPTLSLTKE
ncbi:unnamed protein product [Macrosiphum euphorbiae]|uniref:Uncharacterized protein n=1 Tax=Macrosiphum euphorbiae TaxID=13131 RepID=A0AAV0X3Q4_9HEMI|nr:unnamed protein product [Macrosiphum euphorbiae]